jgi:hypothetical protein
MTDEKSKDLWVSISMGLYVKNKPKSYLGINAEQWVFAKEKPMSLGALLAAITTKTIEFCINTDGFGGDTAEQQAELELFKQFVNGIKIEEKDRLDL